MIEHQVETARRLVGVKPSGLSAELDAPSVWSTISAVASKMEEIESSLSDNRLKAIVEKSTGRPHGSHAREDG